MVTFAVGGAMRYDLQSGEPLWPDLTDTEGCGPQVGYAERLGVGLAFCDGVRAFDLDTGATVESPFDQQAGISCALLDSPDGTSMVQASCNSGDYVLWRLGGDGAASRLLPQNADEQFVLGYSADGKSVFAEQADGQRTQLVNPMTGSVKHLQGIFGPTRTSDPSEVFVAYEDGTGGRYDIESP